MAFGFEYPANTGGEGSPLTLPALLGGVLKGDAVSSTALWEASGAKVARAIASTEDDFGGIFGFPARLMGGGTGGAEATDRSLLRGSLDGDMSALEKKGDFDSNAGVPSRLESLNSFLPLDGGAETEDESRAACDVGREGCGESIWDSDDLDGGDLGDWIRTLGGDLVGDLGGEKATIEVGLGFGLPHGIRSVPARGVAEAAPPL